MFKIPRPEYTAEFKELAVKRVRSGQGIAAVARELRLVEQTLRNRVSATKAGKLDPPGTKAITPEQVELSRMRADIARLRMTADIVVDALTTAWFRRKPASGLIHHSETVVESTRRSTLFRRSDSLRIGSAVNTNKQWQHDPVPLEDEKPREAHNLRSTS